MHILLKYPSDNIVKDNIPRVICSLQIYNNIMNSKSNYKLYMFTETIVQVIIIL